MKRYILLVMALPFIIGACGAGKPGAESAAAVSEDGVTAEYPVFNPDSAYAYVERQVAFGPRVPGSESHRRCASWLAETMRGFGADTVMVQQGEVTAFNGDRLPIYNIMARYNASSPSRILLLSHWDSRPWADADPNPANHTKPVPAANDGASGVGVLMEIARQLQMQNPQVGVDLLFVDAEDYGLSGADGGDEETWCLGTQYWTRNMPYDRYSMPRYAVLLDMVGGKGARFHRELFSDHYAGPYVDKVWNLASSLGHDRFVNSVGTGVIDDHIFLLKAGIPAIDIIDAVNSSTGTFPPTWHTLADDMTGIDPAALGDVGDVLIHLIYNEK